MADAPAPVKGKLASLVLRTLDSRRLRLLGVGMTYSTRKNHRRRQSDHHMLPRGRRGLVALQVAREVRDDVRLLSFPRGTGHIKDQLLRASECVVLRLAEASGRTAGNRYLHLEAAYAENQETQEALRSVIASGVHVELSLLQQADRCGGLIFGLLRAERRIAR